MVEEEIVPVILDDRDVERLIKSAVRERKKSKRINFQVIEKIITEGYFFILKFKLLKAT